MASDSATLDMAQATASNMEGNVPDVTVPTEETDSADGSKETSYVNDDWSKQFGYYLNIPEVKAAIDTRAIWTVGKRWTTPNKIQEVELNRINGCGTDTFQTILQNLIVVKRIGGDSFAEVIRNPKTGKLLNLKPLDPGKIKIVANEKGIIKRYEQLGKGENKKFKPQEILHLSNKRVADQIHGTSDIDAIEHIILASNETFTDVKKMYHRYVKPLMKFELDTDDQTKIDKFIAKMDDVVAKGENIYIPKDTVSHELVTVPSSSTLSPFSWIDHLKNYFYQVVGIPQIILGNAAEFSESSAKIAYLSFQQSVEAEQRDIIDQVWNQLAYRIDLEFPATIQK